jgi:hypothetical protein
MNKLQKIEKYANEAATNLDAKGIVNPKWVSRKDFTMLTFTLINPVTEEVIDTYEMTEQDFINLSYDKRKPYKELKKTEVFDEKAFNKAEKNYRILQDKRNAAFEKEYLDIITARGLSEKALQMFSDIMKTVEDTIDFNDFNDPSEYRIEFEDDILDTIIRNLKY